MDVQKQKFYTWSMDKGYSKRAVWGIPIDLGYGEEGFVLESKDGYTVYHGKTGNHIFSVRGKSEEQLKNCIEIARNRIRRTIENGSWVKLYQDFISKYGVSPRYDENGNVKPHCLKPKVEKDEDRVFYIQNKDGSIERVEGVFVKGVHPSLKTFYYKKDNKYVISEVTSGIKLAEGVTKKEAVEKARVNINKYIQDNGLDKLYQFIANNCIDKIKNI